MFSICNGAFNRSPPNGTILWKLYDGNIVFNLWLLSGKLWYYGMVSYYSFKAMVPRAPMSIPAPQTFLGQCEQGERSLGRLRRGVGMRIPNGFRRAWWASATASKQRAISEHKRCLKRCREYALYWSEPPWSKPRILAFSISMSS